MINKIINSLKKINKNLHDFFITKTSALGFCKTT